MHKLNDCSHRYQTWLVYDPNTHVVARVLGSRPGGLHQALLRAGGRAVVTRPGETVYVIPRASLR